MPTTPSGLLATPRSKLRDLLAEIPALQTWFGAADAAAAKAKIYSSLLADDELADLRPLAVVQWASYSLGKIASGAANYLWPSPGECMLRLILQDVDRGEPVVIENSVDPASLEEGDVVFDNNVGAVLRGLADRAAVDDRLAINRIALETPPMRNPIGDWPSCGVFMTTTYLIGFE